MHVRIKDEALTKSGGSKIWREIRWKHKMILGMRSWNISQAYLHPDSQGEWGSAWSSWRKKISDEMNERLLRPKEVEAALHQMTPLKAPRSDGFNAYFFQKNWTIVGPKVCKAVLFL